jgi:hypothetical protein
MEPNHRLANGNPVAHIPRSRHILEFHLLCLRSPRRLPNQQALTQRECRRELLSQSRLKSSAK